MYCNMLSRIAQIGERLAHRSETERSDVLALMSNCHILCSQTMSRQSGARLTRDRVSCSSDYIESKKKKKQKKENCLKLSIYIECGDATIHDAVISR